MIEDRSRKRESIVIYQIKRNRGSREVKTIIKPPLKTEAGTIINTNFSTLKNFRFFQL